MFSFAILISMSNVTTLAGNVYYCMQGRPKAPGLMGMSLLDACFLRIKISLSLSPQRRKMRYGSRGGGKGEGAKIRKSWE